MVRFARTVLGALLSRRRLGARDESRLRFRIWPGDLDFNFHLNDGRFLTLMDLGRLDLIVRTGLLRVARKRKWFPVVGKALLEYQRPLHLLQRFTLTTRILGWDAKWFYIEHRMERAGKPIAVAFLQTLIRAKGRSVPTAEVLEALGVAEASPPLPPEVARFFEPAPPPLAGG